MYVGDRVALPRMLKKTNVLVARSLVLTPSSASSLCNSFGTILEAGWGLGGVAVGLEQDVWLCPSSRLQLPRPQEKQRGV